MIMMMFVYVMMDLLGRQFGAFVPLMVRVFGMLFVRDVFRLLRVAAADDGRPGVPVLTVPTAAAAVSARRRLDRRALFHVVTAVQQFLLLLVSEVLELFVEVMVVGRYVRHRLEVVRAPRHLGRLRSRLGRRRRRQWRCLHRAHGGRADGLTTLRPRPVIVFTSFWLDGIPINKHVF